MFERLKRLARGDNRDYAPSFLISLLSRFIAMLERLRRLAKGANKD